MYADQKAEIKGILHYPKGFGVSKSRWRALRRGLNSFEPASLHRLTAIVSLGLQHLKWICAASQSHSSVTTSTCPKKCQKWHFFSPQNKWNVHFQCIYSRPRSSKALLKVFRAGTGEVDCVAGKFLWTFYDILICWSTTESLSSITAVNQSNVTSFCSNLSADRQQLRDTQKWLPKSWAV